MLLRDDTISFYVIKALQWMFFLVSYVYTSVFKPNKTLQLPHISDPILLKNSAQIQSKIRNGELKPRQVVQAYLDRISKVNPILNAVVQFKDDAMKKANELDGQVPRDDQPLFGIPFTCKDLCKVKGMVVTCGHPVNAKSVCTTTEEIVENVEKAGAILTCLTNVPEFCMYYDSDNRIYGRTNNPYDVSRICGGSSGGEGAIIASGGSLMGIGTDIAGSIRMPSFFCGIYGHKTSPGVIPMDADNPVKRFSDPLAVAGPMCRYVDDIVPMLKALAGKHISKLPKIDEEVDVTQIRVYYMFGCKDPLQTPLSHDSRAPVEKAVAYFKGMGLKCEEVNIPEFHNSFNVWLKAFVDNWPTSYIELMRTVKPKANLWFEILKAFFGKSDFTNKTLLLAVLVELELWRRKESKVQQLKADIKDLRDRFQEMLGSNGVFLYPSHPEVAPKHEMVFMKIFNWAYTGIFNVLYAPVTQVPMGLNKEGIPTGLQIAAATKNDHLTIAMAKVLDKAFGGWVPPS